MTDDANQWSLSNPGPENLLVWLEPWAEEFDLPARSTITLRCRGTADNDALGEMEFTPDHLVVWANAATVEVFIDDVFQESGSSTIPIPEGLTKKMLGLMFENQPAARLGGAFGDTMANKSWWSRLRHRLGF